MPDEPTTLDKECFFVAPIGDEGTEIRKRSDGILKFVVGRAAEELGLKAVRADEIATPGQITLQVIDHILGARAVVADLTGRNPNVFYELAIRHAARLPVALILDKDDPPLPFDIAQMRAIRLDHRDLESADRCRQAIVAHLREGLAGAVDSPVATSIDLRALAGGNQLERSVAELVDRVEELARFQRQEELVDRVEELTRLQRRLARRVEEAGVVIPAQIEASVMEVVSAARRELLTILVSMRKDNGDEELLRRLTEVQESLDWIIKHERAKALGRRGAWSEEHFISIMAQLGPPPLPLPPLPPQILEEESSVRVDSGDAEDE